MNWEEYKVLAEKTLSTEFHCSKKDELLLLALVNEEEFSCRSLEVSILNYSGSNKVNFL